MHTKALKGYTMKRLLLAVLLCLPLPISPSDHRADGLVVVGTLATGLGLERLSKLPQDVSAAITYSLMVAMGIVMIIKSSEIVNRLG